jgi:hypothetical protein
MSPDRVEYENQFAYTYNPKGHRYLGIHSNGSTDQLYSFWTSERACKLRPKHDWRLRHFLTPTFIFTSSLENNCF